MTELQLNIGLDGSTVNAVYNALLAAKHIKLDTYRIAQSNTEPTVVAIVHANNDNKALAEIHSISKKLNQDCIAVYDYDYDVGYLKGPKAAAWGAFDLDKFILYNEYE